MANKNGNRYGSGSIYNRGKRGGKTVWECVVSFGKNPVTGRYEQVSRTVVGTKAEAKHMCEQLKQEHESGISADGLKVTFQSYANDWLREREESGNKARTTLDDNKTIVRSFCQYVGNVPVHDFNAKLLRDLFSAIRKDGNKGNSRMRKYHAVMNGILKQAVVDDLLMSNPMDKIETPRCGKSDRTGLSKSDSMALQKALDDAERDAYDHIDGMDERRRKDRDGGEIVAGLDDLARIVGVKLVIMTGIRRGELLGLVWDDIDLDAKKLHVHKSLNVHGDRKDPKTPSGNRYIPLADAVCASLSAWKDKQTELLSRISVSVDDNTPVVCSATGTFCNTSNFSAWWSRFRKRLGFPELRLHELRHNYASHLLSNGMPIPKVSKLLGHDKQSTTLDFYSHAIGDDDDEAANIMNSVVYVPQFALVDAKSA